MSIKVQERYSSTDLETNARGSNLDNGDISLHGDSDDIMVTSDSGCYDDETNDPIEADDDQMRSMAYALSAMSLESVTSGISSGSCASEDRLSLLKCVASYSNVCSKPPATTSCPQKRKGSSSARRRQRLDASMDKKKCSFDCDSLSHMDEVYTMKRSKSVPAVFFENETNDGDYLKDMDSCSVSKSTTPHCRQGTADDLNIVAKHKQLRRKDSTYDPSFEKSKTFLHGQGKTFSKANEYLTPARPGLQKIQVSYTQTNTENNYRKLFYDLIKTAHRQNIIVTESVKNLERRLFFKRNDPKKATSFYEHKGLRDPARAHRRKVARTIADKMKERKEKIKQTSNDMKMGYVPREKSIVLPGPEDIERLRSCRYLRVQPKMLDI